jgi:hypothetical protein
MFESEWGYLDHSDVRGQCVCNGFGEFDAVCDGKIPELNDETGWELSPRGK